MKIIGISASPRANSNTDSLLEQALKGAESKGAKTEKISLAKLKFSPCIECGGCDKTGVCVLKDGLTPIYKKINEADGVILASPIFFGSLSAQAKAMIDRFQSEWIAKYILKKDRRKRPARGGSAYGGKKGVFLCVSASGRKDFFENAKSITRNFFAVINAKYEGELFSPRVEKKGEIRKYKATLKKAHSLGVKLAKGK